MNLKEMLLPERPDFCFAERVGNYLYYEDIKGWFERIEKNIDSLQAVKVYGKVDRDDKEVKFSLWHDEETHNQGWLIGVEEFPKAVPLSEVIETLRTVGAKTHWNDFAKLADRLEKHGIKA